MNRLVRWSSALSLATLLCWASHASAQERGRTDGPEGSEYGKGGYDDGRGGPFSLEFIWGAAFYSSPTPRGAPEGPPLFVGLTGAFWADDWFQLELSGAYLFDGGRINALVGPRFRTAGYPVSLNAGLKAGGLVIPEEGFRFGISPQVGADIMLYRDRLLLGLNYAADIPLGGGSVANRVFMNVGYRF